MHDASLLSGRYAGIGSSIPVTLQRTSGLENGWTMKPNMLCHLSRPYSNNISAVYSGQVPRSREKTD